MAGLNDNILVSSHSTSIKKLSASNELQERFLTQINEPLQSRPRPRNLLSKFTITSPNPSQSCLNLIPAYRTCVQESLPILSPEDKKKMNISSFSGLLFHNNCSSPQESISNFSPDGVKTRKCLLEKKTIHRSLEDLSRASSTNKFNLSFDDPPTSSSFRSRNSIPFSSGDSFSTHRHLSTQQESFIKQDGNGMMKKSSQASPNSPLCQQRRMNSLVQTDNIINTDEERKRKDGVVVTGGETCYSATGGSNSIVNIFDNVEEKVVDGNLRSLSIENELLKKRIKEERRKCIFYRIVNAFAFEALRRRSQRLVQIEESLVTRKVECAARVILHHLLLNSWKMTKGQVTAISVENAQMHKTVNRYITYGQVEDYN